MFRNGAPVEMTIRVIAEQKGRDLIIASDKLTKDAPKLLEKGLETIANAPDTVTIEEYKKMSAQKFEM